MECVYSIVRWMCVLRKQLAETLRARDACILQCGLHSSLECISTPLDGPREAAYRSARVMPPPKIRDVVCRDARVRVTEVGDGKPLLLLHDFLSDRDEWAAVMGTFAERFRVIAVDLPGFGESEKPRPKRFAYDFDAFADAIVDVAAALDAAPLSICGHGLGAAIAIALAERHPSSVERVVLVVPADFSGARRSRSRARSLCRSSGTRCSSSSLGGGCSRGIFGVMFPCPRIVRPTRGSSDSSTSSMRPPRAKRRRRRSAR